MSNKYNQIVSLPFGYTYTGNYRIYKARYSREGADQLVHAIGNANLIQTLTGKSGKVIVVVTDFSTSKTWDIIRQLKITKPPKQLLLNLKP